jgi:hypothetical protein
MAFGALDPDTQAVWAGALEDLVNEYCFWPDQWFDPGKFAAIDPYQLVIDDIQFHYPPIHPVEYEYAYWRMDGAGNPRLHDFGPNRTWGFFRTGVTHYLRAICDDLSRGRVQDAAKRLGILLHFFQDTHELHSLEGEQGTDIFVFDRLLPGPEEDPYITPTSWLINPQPPRGDIRGYRPVLKGVTVPEAVLLLYARYAEVLAFNRRRHLPIILARQEGREEEAQDCFREIAEAVARLSADVWHTATALATQRFDPDQVRMLDVLYLDRLCPLRRPRNSSSAPYRFSPMVPGACLDRQRHRHPLQVRMADGSPGIFERGWGGGGHAFGQSLLHELPQRVYQRLKGWIGLHDPLGQKGNVEITVERDGETVLADRLHAGFPSAEVDIPVADGGELRFTVRDAKPGNPDDNHVAWCDLRLVKGIGPKGA